MEPFIAQIMMFAGNFAPRGWALCDGQTLQISQYTALFSILGTTYGGDGRTTFALPDLRGRLSMHPGSGPGLSSHKLGAKGGAESVTLTVAQMPNHTHTIVQKNSVSSDEADSDEPTNSLATTDSVDIYKADADAMAPASYEPSTTGEGGGQSHDNMQPYTCVNYIIALEGVFPSRN